MWGSSSTQHGCCRTQTAHIHTRMIQPTCFCCCRTSAKSIIHFAEWTVVPLLVKGSFQMAISGDLKLTGQQNTAWATKEFAFLGCTPNSVILMLCQRPLSLTSDCTDRTGSTATENLPMSYITGISGACRNVQISARARKFTSLGMQSLAKLDGNDSVLEGTPSRRN